jgi:hypothetical protein
VIAYCSLTASGVTRASTGSRASRRSATVRRERARAEERFERGNPESGSAWEELEAFVAGAPVVVRDLSEFEAWIAHCGGRRTGLAIGLGELEALFGPFGDERVSDSPEAIRARARAIVDRFLREETGAVELLIAGYRKACAALESGSPRGAAVLRFALALVDRLGSRDPDARIAEPADLVDDVVPA